jgi:mRNA interferase MazF
LAFAGRGRSVELFVIGDIVVVPFPFTNLRGFKRRPALVLAYSGSDDLILCQITSQNVKDGFAVSITPSDTCGKLLVESNIRPNKFFTVEKSLVLYKIAPLGDNKLKDVGDKLSELFGI